MAGIMQPALGHEAGTGGEDGAAADAGGPDILVTPSTTESFNIVLPLLGAIVTDTGGLLSHAAIVSRELGIPGVVGTRGASKQIADGAALRVDGLTGEVFVL